jgi:hypothetical protein
MASGSFSEPRSSLSVRMRADHVDLLNARATCVLMFGRLCRLKMLLRKRGPGVQQRHSESEAFFGSFLPVCLA